MKIYPSYLALCVIATLHAPQAYAEAAGNAAPNAYEKASKASAEAALGDDAEQATTSYVDPVEEISSFYSDMDMRLRLAVKADEKACSASTCAENLAFDARVQLIGESLAKSAYIIYPDLKKTTPQFSFDVVDKKVLGSASNASGKVVLFRSIQHLDLDDTATAFIIGREMGHVIAHHHKSNAKTKLLFTVLTGVLFPAASIISASSAAAQATTATTLMTSAASTVTSIVGSEVALSRIKPTQLTEADDIAMALLEYDGLTTTQIAQSLAFIPEKEQSDGWEKDLYLSVHNVNALAGEPADVELALDALPEAPSEPEPEPEPEEDVVVAALEETPAITSAEEFTSAPQSQAQTNTAEAQMVQLAPVEEKLDTPKSQEARPQEIKPQETKLQTPITQSPLPAQKSMGIANATLAANRPLTSENNRPIKKVTLKKAANTNAKNLSKQGADKKSSENKSLENKSLENKKLSKKAQGKNAQDKKMLEKKVLSKTKTAKPKPSKITQKTVKKSSQHPQ